MKLNQYMHNMPNFISEDKIKAREVYFSLSFHFIVILGTYLGSQIWWKYRYELSDTTKMQTIKSSVRVDIVAMPKYTLKELQHMNMQVPQPMLKQPAQKQEIKEQTLEKGPSAAEQDKNAELEIESKASKLEEMLKKLGEKKINLKSISHQSETKNTVDKANADLPMAQGDLDNLLYAGNKLRKGIGKIGDGNGEVDASELSNYLAIVKEQVKQNWKLPSYLLEKPLKCRIRIFISQIGDLIQYDIQESSGTPDFDQKAIEALKLAVPFPPPHKSIVNTLVNGEIILGFPL